MQITGIIGAMDVEVAILRSMMKNARTETVSGIDFIIGSLEGRRVVLARSGMGKVFAALCAQTMILKVGTGAAVGEFVQEAAAGLWGDRNAFGEGVVRKEARGTLALWPAGRTGRAPVNRPRHVRRQNCVKKARVVQRSDAGRKSKARPDQTINGTFWDYNPKKAEHSGNIIPIFAKLKTYRRDGQGFGGASNAFAKLAGSAGSWSMLSGETTVTGMFG